MQHRQLIAGICAVTTTWAAVIIGAIGSVVTTFGQIALVKLKVDDPVGASAVHLMGSLWGILSCGIFGLRDNIEHSFSHHDGLVWVRFFNLTDFFMYKEGVFTVLNQNIVIFSQKYTCIDSFFLYFREVVSIYLVYRLWQP